MADPTSSSGMSQNPIFPLEIQFLILEKAFESKGYTSIDRQIEQRHPSGECVCSDPPGKHFPSSETTNLMLVCRAWNKEILKSFFKDTRFRIHFESDRFRREFCPHGPVCFCRAAPGEDADQEWKCEGLCCREPPEIGQEVTCEQIFNKVNHQSLESFFRYVPQERLGQITTLNIKLNFLLDQRNNLRFEEPYGFGKILRLFGRGMDGMTS